MRRERQEKTKSSKLLWLSAASALAAIGAPAAAQSTSDIIVPGQRITVASSGTKTDTPLIETAQSISVITSEQFEAQGATTLQDTMLYTAGVRSDAYGSDARGDWAFVRGSESWVEYLDGLRFISGFNNGARPDPYTLERVDVVRGPASVLYGQGASVGVVNLTSKTPSDTFGGEVAVEIGNFERRQVQADVTGPLGAGWSYRVVGLLRDSEQYVDYAPDDRIVIAPTLAYRDPDTSIVIRALWQEDDNGSSTNFLPHEGTLLPSPNGQIPFSRFVSEPGFDQYDTETAFLSWSFEQRFTDTLRFRQNFRYTESSAIYQSMYPDVYSDTANPFIDPDRRVLNRYVYVEHSDATALGIDNQLLYDVTTGPVEHKLLGGFDYSYFHEEDISGGDASAAPDPTVSPPVTPIDIFNPVYTGYGMPPLFASPSFNSWQMGLYLQDEMTIFDRWIATAAIRRDYARAQSDGEAQKDWATTSRIGLLYRSALGLSPYVSYSEAFIPINDTDSAGNLFRPQTAEQWEAGLKYQPEGAPYIVTASLYQITEQNRLVSDPGNPFFSIQTGEVELRGVELEASGRFLENTQLVASYTYTEAETTKSTDPTELNRQFEGIPEHMASAWVLQTFPLGEETELRAGFGARYVGERYAYDAAKGTLTVPSNTLYDASLAFDYRNWTLTLTANNLFDGDYIATCLGRGDCFVGTGRRMVANLAYHF